MLRPIALCALLPLIACGPKNTGGVTAAANPAKLELGDQVPDDANSKAFATALIQTSLTNLRVTDSGAVLTYRSMSFQGDGNWRADGDVAIGDEKMECTEGGTWTMDAAESANVADLTWAVADTNCAGRETGEQRAKLTVEDGDVQVRLR